MHNQKQWLENCFRQYYQSLTYFAYNYLQDKDQAEDIVQNVFLKLLDTPVIFKDEKHLKYYLYKSIKNSCINELNMESIHSEIISNLYAGEPRYDETLFQEIVRAEVYQQIIAAINKLPKECSKIFRMSYIDQLENDEIAEKLSISINTVKVQKNRGKQKLKELLKNVYPGIIIPLFLIINNL